MSGRGGVTAISRGKPDARTIVVARGVSSRDHEGNPRTIGRETRIANELECVRSSAVIGSLVMRSPHPLLAGSSSSKSVHGRRGGGRRQTSKTQPRQHTVAPEAGCSLEHAASRIRARLASARATGQVGDGVRTT